MHHLSWNIDPILVHVGPLTLRWYGLCFALGLLLAYEAGQRIMARDGMQHAVSERLAAYIVVGTIVGARLGHCLFYEPGYYLTHPLQILFFWKGGLASHGGTAGIVIAVWLFARQHGYRVLWLLDRTAVIAPIAACAIRIGNFFNSEIVGNPTTVPWAVVFPRVDMLPRHPAQLYEALAYAVIAVIMYRAYRSTTLQLRAGALFGLALTLIFSFRFVVEYIKAPQVAFESRLPIDLGQLLSIPVVLIGVWLLLRRAPATA